jgi:hypothetical protein
MPEAVTKNAVPVSPNGAVTNIARASSLFSYRFLTKVQMSKGRGSTSKPWIFWPVGSKAEGQFGSGPLLRAPAVKLV